MKKPGTLNDQPPHLPGFGHIRRYWDNQFGIHAAKILPGEYYVTIQNELIMTVLGSCVSACIRDRIFGIGGMNHFMLPMGSKEHILSNKDINTATRYGNYAMEKLINDILKHGGKRENLEIKIFGGGRVMQQMQLIDVGRRNIDFVRNYIETEGLNLIAENVGDVHPRKIVYQPESGRVRMKKLRLAPTNIIVEREYSYIHELGQKPLEGEIELF